MSNYVETLADRVRRAIENTGLSHAEFARQAKIKPRTLQDVLGGQSINPEMATLQGISKRSGVPVDELIFGMQKPKEKKVGEISIDELVARLVAADSDRTHDNQERELLRFYRESDDITRANILDHARDFWADSVADASGRRKSR